MSPKTLVWFIRFRKRQLKKSGLRYKRKLLSSREDTEVVFSEHQPRFQDDQQQPISWAQRPGRNKGLEQVRKGCLYDHSKTFKLIMCPVWTEREHLCLCQSIISHLVLKEKLKITKKKRSDDLQHQGSGQLFKHRLDVVLHHWRKSKKDSSKTSLYSSFFLNRNLASRRNSFCIECRTELNSKAGDKHTRG